MTNLTSETKCVSKTSFVYSIFRKEMAKGIESHMATVTYGKRLLLGFSLLWKHMQLIDTTVYTRGGQEEKRNCSYVNSITHWQLQSGGWAFTARLRCIHCFWLAVYWRSRALQIEPVGPVVAGKTRERNWKQLKNLWEENGHYQINILLDSISNV